jgi:hypothetical protein
VRDRDEKGRFVKGNPGNPNAKGRPKRKTEDKYLRTLQQCAAKEWKAICERAVKDAKGGDKAARQWLSDYLLGKPVQEFKVDAKTDVHIILNWDDDNPEKEVTE